MRQCSKLTAASEPLNRRGGRPIGQWVLIPAACQFFLVGEPLLQAVEHPDIVNLAQRILGCEEVHVGACGLGDASKIVSADGRLQQQVHWHADGGPEVEQVSLRTALDRHDPSNAPLRVLPGTHARPREEVEEELRQIEIATGQYDEMPECLFAKHPREVEVILDPRWSLVWTPSCWHATGVKTAGRPAPRHGVELLSARWSQARCGNPKACD